LLIWKHNLPLASARQRTCFFCKHYRLQYR
jgi:hypothetical protein